MFQIFMSFSVIFDKEHWDRPPATRQRGVSLTERLGARGAGFISGPRPAPPCVAFSSPA